MISAPAWDTQAERLIYPIAPWHSGYRALNHRLSSNPSEDKIGRYICPECQDPVFPKRGIVVRWHFSHYPKSSCSYDFQSESDAHRLAKHIIYDLLTQQRPFKILGRKCGLCPATHPHTFITYNSADKAQMEWTIQSGLGGSRADVALLNQGRPRYLFEIYQTHRTQTDRPEPWFELLAGEILELDLTATEIRVQDLRSYICVECQIPDPPPEPLILRGIEGDLLVPSMPLLQTNPTPLSNSDDLKIRIQKFYEQKRAEQARIQKLQAEYIAQNTPLNHPLRTQIQAQVSKLNSGLNESTAPAGTESNSIPAIYTHRLKEARSLFRERVKIRRREAAQVILKQYQGGGTERDAKRPSGLILTPPVAQRQCRRS